MPSKKSSALLSIDDNGIEATGKISLTCTNINIPENDTCSLIIDGQPFANGITPSSTIDINTADFHNGVHELQFTSADGNTLAVMELFFNNGKYTPPETEDLRTKWLDLIGTPENYNFTHSITPVKEIHKDNFVAKLYRQNNGPGTWQRLLILKPKNLTAPAPAVMIPFYYPETMAAMNLETGEDYFKPGAESICFGRRLAERGFITAMSETYHITYIQRPTPNERDDFKRWRIAATLLADKHPKWTGVGKLMADTSLALDALTADPDVDTNRIAIMGHSLGGKMAFYTGCLDPRVKVIVSSDFGIGWEQTNWSDPWYWGRKLTFLRAAGMNHSQLLACAAPKPFMLIAGQYDDNGANAFFAAAKPYYDKFNAFDKLRLLNHASGHRPPQEAVDAAYDFIQENI